MNTYINENTHKGIYISRITADKINRTGCLEIRTTGAYPNSGLRSILLPQCEYLPGDLDFLEDRIQLESMVLLERLRRVFYLATEPESRSMIFNKCFDVKTRRKFTLKHNVIATDGRIILKRLFTYEQSLIKLASIPKGRLDIQGGSKVEADFNKIKKSLPNLRVHVSIKKESKQMPKITAETHRLADKFFVFS